MAEDASSTPFSRQGGGSDSHFRCFDCRHIRRHQKPILLGIWDPLLQNPFAEGVPEMDTSSSFRDPVACLDCRKQR